MSLLKDLLTDTASDNIASDDEMAETNNQPGVSTATADTAIPTVDPADEYMQRFDDVRDQIDRLDKVAKSIDHQPDQDHRLAVVMDYIRGQQTLINDMYDLLVEMNNFFAPK